MRATRYNTVGDLGEHLPPILTQFCATVAPVSECVPWPGKVDADGYGKVSVLGRRGTVAAHRAVFLAMVGPITPGDDVDHRCDTPSCCNPSHLAACPPVTNGDRARSPQGAGRRARRATGLCVKGHDDWTPNGHGNGMACRTCKVERDREREQAISAAARVLGLSYRAYRATYGGSVKVAARILSERGA